MSILKQVSRIVIICTLLTSCDNIGKLFPKSAFDAPFPKHNHKLNRILGDSLTLKTKDGIESLLITSIKNNNLITDTKTGDTIFYGAVSRYRGIYYFSQPDNDSTYSIYAVKVKSNLVYGLNTAWLQALCVEHLIENGEYPEMVKYKTPNMIRLHPIKKEMKKLFAAILDSIVPDTIVSATTVSPLFSDTTETITPIDSDEYSIIEKVYPNPATDFVNIELHTNKGSSYRLTNLQGKTMMQGQFAGMQNKIDISSQPAGVYALIVMNMVGDESETVKVVKAR